MARKFKDFVQASVDGQREEPIERSASFTRKATERGQPTLFKRTFP